MTSQHLPRPTDAGARILPSPELTALLHQTLTLSMLAPPRATRPFAVGNISA